MPEFSSDVACFVIGGYLGAGKTTLVNYLLRHAQGRRIAVMVNDFGDLPIDADLIESHQGQVMNLSGGCLCCSFGSDLLASLQQVLAGDPPPDLVLIETSGVALPKSVVQSARLVSGLKVQASLVVLDAERWSTLLADPYLHDTVQLQWQQADIVILNKSDLCDEPRLAALQSELSASGQVVLVTEQGALDLALLLDLPPRLQASDWPSGGLAGTNRKNPSSSHAMHLSVSLQGLSALPLNEWEKRLDSLLGLVRAKGFLTDEKGNSWLLHRVGTSHQWQPLPDAAAMKSRLVMIGVPPFAPDLARETFK
jgi:G3E family GTPase